MNSQPAELVGRKGNWKKLLWAMQEAPGLNPREKGHEEGGTLFEASGIQTRMG